MANAFRAKVKSIKTYSKYYERNKRIGACNFKFILVGPNEIKINRCKIILLYFGCSYFIIREYCL